MKYPLSVYWQAAILLQSLRINIAAVRVCILYISNQASLEELMEGTSGATLTVYDEAALCSSTFKILRGMVHTWMNEVSTHNNFYADLQLQHFYR